MEAAVDLLLAPPEAHQEPPPRTDPKEYARRRMLRRARRAGRDVERAELKKFRDDTRETFNAIQAWWLDRMRSSDAASLEKLTLFWHGHFATSQTKVRFNHIMLAQNETLRRLGSGPFRELCSAMFRDPAMLVWLDGRRSEAKAPNENFAREIMELFALGEGHYSEKDIREAARCFTGWTVNSRNGEAVFVAQRHDSGIKTLLGEAGNFDGEKAVEIICAQPRCAEFLTAKLWEFYAYPKPEPELIKSLAGHFRAHDMRTSELLREIFTHPDFYSPRARATQVKSPVQWLVQAARETGRQLLPPGISLSLAAELGQNLFVPPSVKGWDGGAAWINSATLIRRSNAARLFAVAAPPLPEAADGSLDAIAWRKVAPPEVRSEAGSLVRRLESVLLASPASPSTKRKLEELLEQCIFPCDDDAVRDASIVLLASPEYNLC